MHSFIFQLSTRPLSEEQYLSEDAVVFEASRYADYVSELKEGKRAEAITELVSSLPSDMFGSNADGTFSYLGGYEKWVKMVFIPHVQEAAMAMKGDKIAGFGSSYEVKKRVDNPLNTGILFLITDENMFTEAAKQSGDFMEDFIGYMEPGTRIYIGGVYDYYF